MIFEEISSDKAKVIGSIMKSSPNYVSGYPWLSVFPCDPAEVIDNPALLNKVVAAAVVASGAIVLGSVIPTALYSLDIVRKDGSIFDVDRHLLSASGAKILERKEIDKNFLEHHSPEIPYYYLS